MINDITGSQKQRFDKEKNRRDRMAAFFYDIAKLMFAGTIIANITVFLNEAPIRIANIVVILLGLIWTYFFARIANRILTY